MPTPTEHIETLIGQGRYFEARSLLDDAVNPDASVRLKQLYALSLSKSGAPQAALKFLEPLALRNPDDAETCGIMGGIYKELFRKNRDTQYAIRSRDMYLRNFEITQDPYTGINAAAMSLMSGRARQGTIITQTLIGRMDPQTVDAWELATLGEAYLLSKDKSNAITYYLRARERMGADWGRVTSVHNQLWLLNHYLPVPAQIQRAFQPPAVVAFVGHMVDRPGRTNRRFPPEIERSVGEAIAAAVKTLNARIGYCSLACGSDILFAEIMADSGGEVEVFLPFAMDDFIETSVRFAGEGWVTRFHSIAKRFPIRYLTMEPYLGNDDLFALLSKVVFGSAIQRASMLNTTPALISLLSGSEIRSKEGGTLYSVNAWPFTQNWTNINIDGLRTDVQPARASAEAEPALFPVRDRDRIVRYLLYISPESLPADQWDFTIGGFIAMHHDPLAGESTFEKKSSYCLMSFDLAEEAMRLSWLVLEQFHSRSSLGHVRLLLDAAPVSFVDKERQHCKVADEQHLMESIQAALPPQRVYSTRSLGSVLALQVNAYLLEFAGVLPVDHSHPVEFYEVHRMS